jgi:hypothetical protein
MQITWQQPSHGPPRNTKLHAKGYQAPRQSGKARSLCRYLVPMVQDKQAGEKAEGKVVNSRVKWAERGSWCGERGWTAEMARLQIRWYWAWRDWLRLTAGSSLQLRVGSTKNTTGDAKELVLIGDCSHAKVVRQSHDDTSGTPSGVSPSHRLGPVPASADVGG